MDGSSKTMKIDRKYENILLLLFCFLAVAIWALPIWFTPGMVGIYDWDPSMHKFEAIHRTVLEFSQWQGHDPWTVGGVPLVGNPAIGGLLSIKGLSVLVFGTFWGLRLGVLIYLFVGFIGAWKLSGIWWRDRFTRLIFSFYVIANPALIYHITVGHFVFQPFYFMPLLFYFLLRFKEDEWSGLKGAIVLGAAFNDSPAYIVQYGVLILICIYIYLYITNYKKDSKKLLRWIIIFIPVFLTLTFYRTMTILQIALDYPRVSNWRTHYEWISLLKFYLFPHTELATVASCKWCATTWELCSYVGIVAFLLVLASFLQGFRWWHAMIALLVWAGIGNDSYFHIMYWIQKIPGFASHLCFTRIRMFTLLFFGIAATWGLNHIWTKYKNDNIRFFRYAVIGIGIFMAVEVLLLSHIIMKSSHIKFAATPTTSAANSFQNISSLPRPKGAPNSVTFKYEAIRMNLGWLRGLGPSHIPGDSARIGRDEPGYVGEFHQNGRVIEPTYWSPNRILLESLDPNIPLVVNMNPGSPWYNNGKQLFPQYRIVEMREPFEVMPDKNGIVELTYRYPGQRLGIIGTIILLIISAVVVISMKFGHRARLPLELFPHR